MPDYRPRIQDRVSHLREVTFRLGPRGYATRGHTIDLSPTGVRLFSERPIKVGDPIDITWADGPSAVTVSGRVVHVKVDLEGSCAGVLFHRPLAPDEFDALLGGSRQPARV
jgi:hypothetical protein